MVANAPVGPGERVSTGASFGGNWPWIAPSGTLQTCKSIPVGPCIATCQNHAACCTLRDGINWSFKLDELGVLLELLRVLASIEPPTRMVTPLLRFLSPLPTQACHATIWDSKSRFGLDVLRLRFLKPMPNLVNRPLRVCICTTAKRLEDQNA